MKTMERPQIVISSALLFLLALILLMLATTGCIRERIEGNYDLQTEVRDAGGFTDVELRGSFRVEIIPDDQPGIEVQAESNVIPYVETWSDGNTLVVQFRRGYNIRENYPVEVRVYTPELEGIRLSGSGRIFAGHFNSSDVSVNLSGSGNIECSFNAAVLDAAISGSGNLYIGGMAGRGELSISGSGKLDGGSLLMETCKARISGSGNMWVEVESSLEGWISGSGSIYYTGDPVVISHISGSGKVIRY